MPENDRGKAKGSPRKDEKRKKGSFKALLLIISILLIILLLGFGAGVYLKWIDVPGLSKKYALHQYPIVGKFFPQSQTNFEPVELPVDLNQPIALPKPTVQPLQQTPTPAPLPLNAAELEQQQKAKQEEGKRITRLARLYGAMKAEEAVGILSQIDDDTTVAIFSRMEDEQVAKILAAMDAKRSAQLTKMMFKGK